MSLPPICCRGQQLSHPSQSADQLRKAATSDRGALEAASTLLRRPPDCQLNAEECCHTLIDNLCVAITTSRRHSKEAQVITNIVRRFLGGLHLRQLVILLGRILPLLRSQATPGHDGHPSLWKGGRQSRPCPHYAHNGNNQPGRK